MTRRTPGFISKRPHRKSRAGCTTCKKKKVKCDELQPSCSYCALRKLDCMYPQDSKKEPFPGSVSPEKVDYEYDYQVSSTDEDFNTSPVETPSWLVPAVNSSSGKLTRLDLDLLHQFKTLTWKSLSVREEAIIDDINREWVPRVALSSNYLLYTILSICASHRNTLVPSKENQNIATLYRQKTFHTYNKALQNITTENYETLLLTSLFLQLLVPPPENSCTDDVMMEWLTTYLAITQGLRILAGLKWSSGIEKLHVFPVFKRELRQLPPPPLITVHLWPEVRDEGEDPYHPNPPTTYSAGVDMNNIPYTPQKLMGVDEDAQRPAHGWQLPAPAFLPPPLMALLLSLIAETKSGSMDLHRPTLLPVLHALSPIFSSLYYYHLGPDVYVRIIVFPTFLTPEFMQLVRQKEPRSLVVMGWYFAFITLIPDMWWVRRSIPRLLQAASNTVMRSDNAGGTSKKILMSAVEGAFRVVRLSETRGREVAARAIFEGWEGVDWDWEMKEDTGKRWEEQMGWEQKFEEMTV